jgi:hypothetical protein
VEALDRTAAGEDILAEDTLAAGGTADWRREFVLGGDKAAGNELLRGIAGAAVLGFPVVPESGVQRQRYSC